MIPKEITQIPSNQEISSSCTSADNTKISKPSSSSKATTTSWSRFKDPRIVRVSRAFGGKDRHSKVYTMRGLRDRRVRLSVPTAIQLYDLQERLGLNQPSKVVDWLLNAAKNEIDELPPLHLQIPHQFLASQSAKQVLKNPRSSTMFFGDPKDAYGETSGRNEEERQFNFGNRQNSSFLPNFSNSTPYNSFPRWDLSLSQPPAGIHGTTAPNEDWHNLSLAPLPSTLSVPYPGFHQVLVNQPGISGQVPCFPSRINAATDTEPNPKQPIFQSVDRLSLQNGDEQNKGSEF